MEIEAVILPENRDRLANEKAKFLVDGFGKLGVSAWRQENAKVKSAKCKIVEPLREIAFFIVLVFF